MGRKVALLHTSLVLIQRERMVFDLLEELLPDVELVNIVEDTMAFEVIRAGAITPELTRRMCLYVLAAESMGVDAIFSTCSSLGPTMDVARKLVRVPIVKIDEAMAQKAAAEGNRIAVLATARSTLKPTAQLIEEKSSEAGRPVTVREALCPGAFEILMQGQVQQHDDLVAQKAREAAQWADTLVLAQATLARLAPRLEAEVARPTLSSLGRASNA